MESEESKQYLKYEDNGDGTITVTAKLDFIGDEEQTIIVAMDFRAMIDAFVSASSLQEMADVVGSKSTHIPNDPTSAEA